MPDLVLDSNQTIDFILSNDGVNDLEGDGH